MELQTQRYYIDASLLRHSSCMRRVFLTSVEGLIPKSFGVHRHKAEYGTAVHKAFRCYYNGGTAEQALAVAMKHFEKYDPQANDWRNGVHLERTLKKYFESYKNDILKPLKDVEGNTRLEITFKDIQLTQNVWLSGTVDMEADYAGQHVLVDHKTTAAKADSNFFSKYVLDIQPRLYVWAYRRLHRITPGFLINGLFLSAAKKETTETCKFARSSVIQYSNEQLDEFEQFLFEKALDLQYYIDELQFEAETRKHPAKDFTHCHDLFFSCPFTTLCELPKKKETEIIAGCYAKRVYDPSLFQFYED